MVVRKTQPLPVECVVRGYVSGSGWKDYVRTGKICGVKLPAGLKESARLPAPIFTPSTKAAAGHDENISFERMCATIGEELAERVRTISIELYHRAAAYAEPRGILLADTKFEFGLLAWRVDLDRRGLHARFVALLAGGAIPCGRAAAFLRQAIRARLSGAHSLAENASRAGFAGGSGQRHAREIPGSLSNPDGAGIIAPIPAYSQFINKRRGSVESIFGWSVAT